MGAVLAWYRERVHADLLAIWASFFAMMNAGFLLSAGERSAVRLGYLNQMGDLYPDDVDPTVAKLGIFFIIYFVHYIYYARTDVRMAALRRFEHLDYGEQRFLQTCALFVPILSAGWLMFEMWI